MVAVAEAREKFMPTIETVKTGLAEIEPFIPEPLKQLHAMPPTAIVTTMDGDGPWKFLLPYRGQPLKDGFYINSSAGRTIPGVSAGLREASHITGWDYSYGNVYKYQPNVEISVDFYGTDVAAKNALALLEIPSTPAGFRLRSESVSSHTLPGDMWDLRTAIEHQNRYLRESFATKTITQLSGGDVGVAVNIAGGAYYESVVYEKVG